MTYEEDIEANAKTGSSEGYEIPAEGIALARLVNYFELGDAEQKTDTGSRVVSKVTLTFELVSKNHTTQEMTDSGVGFKRVFVTLNKTSHATKGKYVPLFKLMNWKGTAKNFTQLLGEAYKVRIVHNRVGDKMYANISSTSGWLIYPPKSENPETGEESILTVPKGSGEKLWFVYEPSMMSDEDYLKQWNSVAMPKNWVQERIMNSLNFKTSRLARLIKDGIAKVSDINDGADFNDDIPF